MTTPLPSVYSFASPNTDVTNIQLQWNYQQNQPPFLPYQPNVKTSICTLQFVLPATLPKPVFLYYRLTNFYQNHRRYVKSFDASQLKGLEVSADTIESNCSPFGKVPNAPNPDTVYYPCGLIANSIFNDTFSSLVSDTSTYVFSSKGIAWPTDKDKYGKLTNFNPSLHVPPMAWQLRNGTNYVGVPDFQNDEHFQVWMRTAGLPNFRKLYGKNMDKDLREGRYTLQIEDNYNVLNFGGTKSIVISTVTFMGGKNPFLGYAYIVAGGICILLAVIFAACHLYAPRKLGDHTHLSWNQPNPSQVSATSPNNLQQ
ncbi:hypothetical protein HMI54_009810 [Coelomomyces lativittatus]|nr:hypothetical protein HMI55_004233 [Coelomomyces lativittatus]KAJ1501641.1 hypothetical protein HMI54_009810 [Coelomomyces lativittatus]